tara:strand:- start:2861 stop:3136 length:276 start_codon:yes stop_codon:yes gene_type:complete
MSDRKIIELIFLNKKVLIKKDEYTFSWTGTTIDCYSGDTGVIEYIDFDYGQNIGDLAFVIRLDESLFRDGKKRVSAYATCDFDSIEFLCAN